MLSPAVTRCPLTLQLLDQGPGHAGAAGVEHNVALVGTRGRRWGHPKRNFGDTPDVTSTRNKDLVTSSASPPPQN